jgi:hypothetical protein
MKSLKLAHYSPGFACRQLARRGLRDIYTLAALSFGKHWGLEKYVANHSPSDMAESVDTPLAVRRNVCMDF